MMTDLVGGQVDMAFDTIATTKPHVDAGTLRAIGATMAKRPPSAPGNSDASTNRGLKDFVGRVVGRFSGTRENAGRHRRTRASRRDRDPERRARRRARAPRALDPCRSDRTAVRGS
jgi:hypothetical protein